MTARIVFIVLGVICLGWAARTALRGILYQFPFGWLRRDTQPQYFWLCAGSRIAMAAAIIFAALG